MTETDMSAEAAWIADACNIFDEHAQALGWERHIYSDNLRALLAKVEALEAENTLLREGVAGAYMRGQMDGRDKERERCAQIAEDRAGQPQTGPTDDYVQGYDDACETVAAAIRKGDE